MHVKKSYQSQSVQTSMTNFLVDPVSAGDTQHCSKFDEESGNHRSKSSFNSVGCNLGSDVVGGNLHASSTNYKKNSGVFVAI